MAQKNSNRIYCPIGGALLLCLALPAAATEAACEIAGEISTVIGKGTIHRQTGEQAGAARGLGICAGDRVETAVGGHVHIRFVDGGLVSVRPSSRLLVEAYRNGDVGKLAAIKFKLEEGIIRSVTGQWGESNRERFRLNTPIAAIGVKGTDFVVKVEGGNTFASVISGAIVMAPLEGACAAALGPCEGAGAALLSADMPGKMLEYLRQGGAPRLVPAAIPLARQGGEAAVGEARGTPPATSDTAATVSVVNQVQAGGIGTDSVGATPASPAQKPLVWLHNVFGWNVPQNTISERFSTATADGRTTVVGNFFISLYRDETTQPLFQPVGNAASFKLAAASANFAQPIAYGRPVEEVAISGARLEANFAAATFTTGMNLSSPSLGKETFAASGSVNGNGVFVAATAGQSLAGAFSTDGLQAGYAFSKSVAGGTVSGLTLWGR